MNFKNKVRMDVFPQQLLQQYLTNNSHAMPVLY